MKKIFIFAAAAAMFASCAKDELINEIDPSSKVEKAIGFSTIADKVTRNAENSTATDSEVYGLENYHTTFSVWGYKNILQSDATYSHTQVFGTSGAGEEITYSEAAVDPFVANSWTYSPLRYWDKTAANYEFHAAAPAGTNWTWTATSENTGEGKGKFTTTGTITNSSLALVGTGDSKVVTGQPDDVFGTADLMIANDVVVNNAEYSNSPVQLHFNHILSRLNIGVRMQGIAVTYDKKDYTVKVGEEDVVVYKSSKTEDAGKMFKCVEATSESETDKYYEITKENDGSYKVSEIEYTVDAGVNMSKAPQVDDKTKPTKGIVNLKGITVMNLNSKGSFDESLATGTTLSNGTSKRWTSTTPTLDLGFPNDKITKDSDGDTEKTTDGFNLSKVVEDDDENEIAVDEYKLLYQGLVIPQVAEYESLAVDGSNLSTTDAKPYVKVDYAIDGENFTAYYNLASIFVNEDATVTEDGYTIYKTEDGSSLYYKDGKYYAKGTDGYTEKTITGYVDLGEAEDTTDDRYFGTDKKLQASKTENGIYLLCVAGNATDEVYECTITPVKISAVAGEADIQLCEGWQNNIWITIAPTAIYFTADVYQWKTKYTEDINVE